MTWATVTKSPRVLAFGQSERWSLFFLPSLLFTHNFSLFSLQKSLRCTADRDRSAPAARLRLTVGTHVRAGLPRRLTRAAGPVTLNPVSPARGRHGGPWPAASAPRPLQSLLALRSDDAKRQSGLSCRSGDLGGGGGDEGHDRAPRPP